MILNPLALSKFSPQSLPVNSPKSLSLTYMRNLRHLAQAATRRVFAPSTWGKMSRESDFIHFETRFLTITTFRISIIAQKSVSIFCDFLRFFARFYPQIAPSRSQIAPRRTSIIFAVSVAPSTVHSHSHPLS